MRALNERLGYTYCSVSVSERSARPAWALICTGIGRCIPEGDSGAVLGESRRRPRAARSERRAWRSRASGSPGPSPDEIEPPARLDGGLALGALENLGLTLGERLALEDLGQ